MKKFFYLLPAIALIFAACSDDNDNDGLGKNRKLTLKASEIVGAPADGVIDAVKLILDENKVLATAKWDKGFDLTLPASVQSSWLETAGSFFELDEEDLKTIAISDARALMTLAHIAGYKNEKPVNGFGYLSAAQAQNIRTSYVYCEKAFTVKGTVVYTEENDEEGEEEEVETEKETWKYNVDLKQGWNRIAFIEDVVSGKDSEFEVTTSIPDNQHWQYGTWVTPFPATI